VNNVDGEQLGVHTVTLAGAVEPGSDVALLAAGPPHPDAVRSVAEDPTLPLAELLSRRYAR